jgi:hypothetical protein
LVSFNIKNTMNNVLVSDKLLLLLFSDILFFV